MESLDKQKGVKSLRPSIKAFFKARSVAVFGASTNPRKSGYYLVQNLISHQFPGNIYPINPKGGTLDGLKIYKKLEKISKPIDLAIIFVPNRYIPDILKQCIEKGVKAAIIEAAGFSEVGEKGKDLKDQIVKITDDFRKIRVIGPNCTGITYLKSDGVGIFSSFVPMPKIKQGSTVIISQSGFINGGFLLDNVTRYKRMGLRAVCAIGNKMDVNENALLEFFMKDPEVETIGLYIESFQDVRRLIKLSNQAQNQFGKRVVMLRSGLSERGAQAISSHTGSLGEKSELIKAAIKQSHAIQADDFREFFRILRTLSSLNHWEISPNHTQNVAIITISGGAGAVISDWCEKYNLNIPKLSDETYAGLSKLFPDWMPPNRFGLIDIWPAVENAAGDYQSVVLETLKISLNDPKINGIFMTAFYSQKAWQMDWTKIKKILEKYRKPVFIWLFGEYRDVLKAERIFERMQLPLFRSEHEMVKIYHSIFKRNKG